MPTSYSQAQSSNPWPGTSYLKTPLYIYLFGGLGRTVGIATRYGLDGPEIESRWGTRFSEPAHTGPEAHPASYTMGTDRVLTGGKAEGAWRWPLTPIQRLG